MKHDGSRVIQTIIKYGSNEQRTQVIKELTGHYLVLAQGPYSKFLVNKILRYGNKEQRGMIVNENHYHHQ